jgi:hypothetical protein
MFFFTNILSTRVNQPLSHFFQIKAGVPITPANSMQLDSENNQKYRYQVASIARITVPALGIEFGELEEKYFTKELDREKELHDTDYLISAKGSIKGISLKRCKKMLETAASEGVRVIANSSFYVVRPHPNSVYSDHTDFLHSMLDALVDFLERKRTDENGLGRDYYTIQDLLNIGVSYPKENIEDKVMELEMLNRNYNEKLSALSDALHNYQEALHSAFGDEKLIDFTIDLNETPNRGFVPVDQVTKHSKVIKP